MDPTSKDAEAKRTIERVKTMKLAELEQYDQLNQEAIVRCAYLLARFRSKPAIPLASQGA